MNLIWPISLLFLPITHGKVCTDDHPSLPICETGSVQGGVVSLDMTSIGSYNESDCVCDMKANTSGFSLNISSGAPVFGECGSRLDIMFIDRSMQMNCGPSDSQSSDGDLATINVSNLGRASAVHAQYCLTFFSEKPGIDMILSCSAPSTPGQTSTPTTPPQGNTTSVQTQSTSNHEATNSSTLVPTTTSSVSLNDTTTNTTDTTTMFPPPHNDTTSNTTHTNTVFPPSTPASNNTTQHPTTPSPTVLSSISTTEAQNVTSANSTVIPNTTVDPLNTTTSANSTVIPNITVDPLNTTSANSTVIPNTTVDPLNTTTSANSTVITNTTVDPLNTTTSANSTVFLSTTVDPLNLTISAKSTVFPNTTVDPLNATTTTNNTVFPHTTVDPLNTPPTTTNNTVFPNTTVDPTNTTTTNNPNTTLDASNTTVPNATSRNTTTAMTNESTPEHNTTANTTPYSNANTTVDNSTESVGNSTARASFSETTKKPSTTEGFWEPPAQTYDEPEKTNIVVIIAPLVGIITLVCIAVFTYVMCKRTRKASRRTRIPDGKTKERQDQNGNVQGTCYTRTPPTDQLKPDTTLDVFTIQSNGGLPARVETENETRPRDFDDHVATTAETNGARRDLASRFDAADTRSDSERKLLNTYEPTEREMDLLTSLELTAITLENDPDDPNRYFTKSDPGDWYRVIMKGKTPKKDRGKRSRKYKSSESRKSKKRSGRHKSRDKSSEKRRSRRHNSESELESSDSSGRRISRSKSSDSNNERSSEIRHIDRPHTGKSSAKRKSENYRNGGNKYSKSDNEHQSVKVIESRPEGVESKPSVVQSKPKVIESKPSVIESKPLVIQSKPRVIESRPSQLNQSKELVPEHQRTRTIMRQSSSEKEPVNMRTGSNIRDLVNEVNIPEDINSTEMSRKNAGTALSSTQSSPSRQRSSLFNRTGGLTQSMPAKETNKRPEIVPPLNLTDTGDHLEIGDDGFEGFVLNN